MGGEGRGGGGGGGGGGGRGGGGGGRGETKRGRCRKKSFRLQEKTRRAARMKEHGERTFPAREQFFLSGKEK